jgi:hypothetical protein
VGDAVIIVLEPDTEKREIKISISLQKALDAKLTQKLNAFPLRIRKNSSFGTPKPRRMRLVLAESRR